jgi:chromosome segregation ATPase
METMTDFDVSTIKQLRLAKDELEERLSKFETSHNNAVIEFRNKTQQLMAENGQLNTKLDEAMQDKQEWIRDYQQLNDRYTLLDSLLRQLQVVVKLPPSKNARRGS